MNWVKKHFTNKVTYFSLAMGSVVILLIYLVLSFIITYVLITYQNNPSSNFNVIITSPQDIQEGVKQTYIAYYFLGGSIGDLKNYETNDYNIFLDFDYAQFAPKDIKSIDAKAVNTYLEKRMTNSKLSRIEKYLNYCGSTFESDFGEREKCLWVHYAYAKNAKLTNGDIINSPYPGSLYLHIIDTIITNLDALNGKALTAKQQENAVNTIKENIITTYHLKTTTLLSYKDNQLTYVTIDDTTSLKDLTDILLDTACAY